MAEIADILDFWFGAERDDDAVIREKSALWWEKAEETDRACAELFGDDLRLAAAGGLDGWAAQARGRLALVVLLDQMSRNIYRDTPQAFAQDERALSVCLAGLDAGHDLELRPVERVFLYLPLEHAESVEHQQHSVRCYEALSKQVPAHLQPQFAQYVDYAVQHLRIIERFGRFPHRNAILGRESTPEETAFLGEEGSSF